MDGVLRCTRYAFGPNKLHYCGPDASQEVLAYINEGLSDRGLNHILSGFETLYPYLQAISRANKIRDSFDERVVEAYWLGNELLDAIPAKIYYRHLTEQVLINKIKKSKEVEKIADKLRHGARMHHSFHVFNVGKRSGPDPTPQEYEAMDQCRVSWGRVLEINGPSLTVERQPIISLNNKLTFGPEQKIKIFRQLEANSLLDEVKVNDFISMHWNVPCEVLTARQLANLKKYTAWSLALANQAI